MNSETYQGWHNWDTWNIQLWLSNDEANYKDVVKIIKRNIKSVYHAERALKKYVTNLLKDNFEISNINLEQINWNEIAIHWIEDLKEV